MTKTRSETTPKSGTKIGGTALVASAAFFSVVGDVGGGVGGGTPGNERVALAVEASASASAAEDAAWEKAATREKTPWRSESGGAAFLPPRPEEEFPSVRSESSEPSSFGWLRTVAEVLFWTLVGAAVLALVGAMVWALRQTARGGVGKDKEKKARAERERRLEAIAPEARERVDDLGTAAENALAAGDLRLALVYFFSWLIVESDKRGLLRARRGKTNREYWLELAVNPGVRTIYKATMDAFERVYFGGRTISRAEFDDVWRLREPFVAAMERLDAERAAAERASREAARRANEARVSANWGNSANPANGANLENGASVANNGNGVNNASVANKGNGVNNASVANNGNRVNNASVANNGNRVNNASVANNGNGVNNASGANNGIGGNNANGGISRIWALPLATAVALGAVASSGCAPKTEYWSENWSDRYAGDRESINGVSIFANYCAQKTRGVEKKSVGVVDGERYETIVWFYPETGGKLFWPEEGETNATSSTTGSGVSGATVALAAPNADFEANDPFADAPEDDFGASDPFADAPEDDFEANDPFADVPVSNVERKKESRKTQKTATPRRVALSDLALEDARPFVESWLLEKPNRTFVFVPDGWRADVDYWRAVQDQAPSEHVAWGASQLNAAEEKRRKPNVWLFSLEPWQRFKAERLDEIKRKNETFWATWEPLDKGKRRERFSGVDAWTAGLPATTDVWASRAMIPDVENGTEVLLSVDGDPFVCRRRVGESDFFALESAAFLLNFALTKPENRVLAGRLVDEFNPKGKTLLWVDERLQFATEPEEEPVSPFSLARLTPFSLAVLHLVALAAFFVAWRFPILGRPKRNAREATNDYSKHVDGVAFLLEKAGARDWARKELETFRAAREAGAAFREPEVDAPNDGGEKREAEENRPPEENWRAKNGERSGRGASRKFFRR